MTEIFKFEILEAYAEPGYDGGITHSWMGR